MPDPLDTHYATVTTAIADGEVVLFLGAGVNLCGRPKGACYQRGKYLPSGGELAEELAKHFKYQEGDKKDLLRVSQYVAVIRGTGPLYKRLYDVFAAKYPTTPLHRFLAILPALLRKKDYPPYQLIVTTNYDDVLECAFEAAGEPFDLVCYVAEGRQRGKFRHQPPEGEARLIEKPNEYHDLSLDQRSVILKIHGAVDRAGVEQSSFVITEDHYIDYLTRTKISGLVPVGLAAKLRTSGYLFLGYGLRDWNLRVILHRIWGEQPLSYQSWAIQLDPKQLDRKFWMKHGVDIINQRLEDYVAALDKRMQALPGAGGEI
ncbi:MAG: SIR2 family protein [Anaerolineae bacterium]|nr:SIR2 family protein [Anaerolineae bacterium]